MKVRRGFTLIEVVTVIGIFTLLSALVISNLQRGKQTQVLRETSQRLVDDVRQMQNKTSVGSALNICKRNKGVDLTTFTDIYQEECVLGSPCSSVEYTCTRVAPIGGYGIFFDRTKLSQYTLYGDFSSVVKRNGYNGIPVQYEGKTYTDSFLSDVTFPENVVIASVWIVPQFNQTAGLVYTQGEAENGNKNCYIPTEGNIEPFSSSQNFSIAWIAPTAKMYAVLIVDDSHGACPDYIINILLKHTKANTCRLITLNGASGLVDETADPLCQIPL